ncbi:hypothetical protein SEVIR_9G405601v4 [Setaria viridis]|uniref:Reverse transcriptase zinc-binding domain-containing protein n=1 Tax=Setaria viridis TaxID=4556 RepID=A0A4U6T4Q6_SETVI|nr:hypothetical protein SEVIR_9G405601v2 [Setaria viridis]
MDRSWSALQIRIEPEVHALYNASVTVQVGNGERTMFWTDNWIDGRSVRMLAPNLLSVIPKRALKTRTVAQGMDGRRWIRDIQGGLSIPVLMECIQLWDTLSSWHLAPEVSGHIPMEVDSGWILHSKICLHHDAQGKHAAARSKTHMEELGTSQSQVLHMACVPREDLDCRSKATTRTGCP